MAGLSDKSQAVLMFASTFSVTLAAAGAVLPVPDIVKPYWILGFGLLGAVGIALKEALGNNSPVQAKTP